MIWINSYVSNSQRMLIWKINKLISSGGIHGWRVGAVVNRQGLCCTFGWTRKSPRQHTGKGHDRADGYPLTLFTRACQTDDATGVTRWSSWIEAKSQVCPPTSLTPQFLSAALSQFILLLHPPILCLHFLPFNSFFPCLPQAKDQLATFTGQVKGSQLQPRRNLTYLLAWGACPGGCSSR